MVTQYPCQVVSVVEIASLPGLARYCNLMYLKSGEAGNSDLVV